MQIQAKNRTLGFLAAALASSFWGCGFFFGKIALAEMNVGAMVFYRFAFATLGLLPLLITHRPRFNPSEWRTLLLASVLGVPLDTASVSSHRSPCDEQLADPTGFFLPLDTPYIMKSAPKLPPGIRRAFAF